MTKDEQIEVLKRGLRDVASMVPEVRPEGLFFPVMDGHGQRRWVMVKPMDVITMMASLAVATIKDAAQDLLTEHCVHCKHWTRNRPMAPTPAGIRDIEHGWCAVWSMQTHCYHGRQCQRWKWKGNE